MSKIGISPFNQLTRSICEGNAIKQQQQQLYSLWLLLRDFEINHQIYSIILNWTFFVVLNKIPLKIHAIFCSSPIPISSFSFSPSVCFDQLQIKICHREEKCSVSQFQIMCWNCMCRLKEKKMNAAMAYRLNFEIYTMS